MDHYSTTTTNNRLKYSWKTIMEIELITWTKHWFDKTIEAGFCETHTKCWAWVKRQTHTFGTKEIWALISLPSPKNTSYYKYRLLRFCLSKLIKLSLCPSTKKRGRNKFVQLKCIFSLMLPTIKIMSVHLLNNHF